MKNKIICSVALGAGVLALIGCGDDITQEINQSQGLESYAAFDELPDCTSENEGEMAFANKEAKVYYCADSSWQLLNGEAGENGKDGESCTIEELDEQNGYKIVCGSDSVGVVLNGAQGAQGKDGAKGETGAKGDKGNTGATGADGTSCTVVALEDNSGYKIVCGSDSVNVCGRYIFDPNKNEECHNGAIYFRDIRVGGGDKLYKTVTIGTQTWMAENLNYRVENSYCYYDGTDEELSDSLANCAKYGRLYTWDDALNACPAGYHLPSDAEWDVLLNLVLVDNDLGTINKAGTYLKSTTGWDSYNGIPAGTDKYGFNGLPAGRRSSDGSYYALGYYGFFWSSTECSSTYAYYYNLYYGGEGLYRDNGGKTYARSVRCLKDSD